MALIEIRVNYHTLKQGRGKPIIKELLSSLAENKCLVLIAIEDCHKATSQYIIERTDNYWDVYHKVGDEKGELFRSSYWFSGIARAIQVEWEQEVRSFNRNNLIESNALEELGFLRRL